MSRTGIATYSQTLRFLTEFSGYFYPPMRDIEVGEPFPLISLNDVNK